MNYLTNETRTNWIVRVTIKEDDLMPSCAWRLEGHTINEAIDQTTRDCLRDYPTAYEWELIEYTRAKRLTSFPAPTGENRLWHSV